MIPDFLRNVSLFLYLSTSLPLATPLLLSLEFLFFIGEVKYTWCNSPGNSSTICFDSLLKSSFVSLLERKKVIS